MCAGDPRGTSDDGDAGNGDDDSAADRGGGRRHSLGGVPASGHQPLPHLKGRSASLSLPSGVHGTVCGWRACVCMCACVCESACKCV